MEQRQTSKINWETDRYLARWLKSKKSSTGYTYRIYFAHYLNWSGMTPEQLIHEKWEDQKKEPIERTDISENRVREFNRWLIENGVQKKKGKKGYAPKTALAICAAIQDFYTHNGVPLNIKLTREFAGATKGINETEKMSANQIEQLTYYAPTLRDKAIVWSMFQGGMDISTALSLNWGHVQKEIDAPPMDALMLRSLERRKEKGRTFNTFLYRTAIKHLKMYLETEFGKDYAKRLTYDSPLFQSRVGERHQAQYVQMMLKRIAPDAGIASQGKLSQADINPLRPHALRASFSDQMSKAGASKQLVDYLMGHKLQYDTSYFGGEEGLRSAYVRYAKDALEPSGRESVDDVKKITADLEVQLRERDEEIKELRQGIRMLRTNYEEQRKSIVKVQASLMDAGIIKYPFIDITPVTEIDEKEKKETETDEKEHRKKARET